MGDSLESTENAPETQNVAVVDFTQFANYLRKAAAVLLPEDDPHLEPHAINAALDDKTNQECIRKFISDPQVTTLYIQRSSSKGNLFFLEVISCILIFIFQMKIMTNHKKVRKKRNLLHII